MTDLSLAARAVQTAAWETYWSTEAMCPDDAEIITAAALAAALRAAADQVVPVPIKADTPERHWALLGVKHRLLAIADELEGQ